MSHFVTSNTALFDVAIKIEWLFDEAGHISGVKAHSVDDPREDLQIVQCKCSRRDTRMWSKIEEVSTLFHRSTGVPLIRRSVLYRQILLVYFKVWNLPTDDGKVAPITEETVDALDPDITKALAREYLRLTRRGANKPTKS